MKLLRLVVSAKTAVFRAIPLLRDARVPAVIKAAAVGAGVLVVSPIDLFSDVPVLGLLDDAALLSLVCVLFVRFASPYVRTGQSQPAIRASA